MSVEEVFSELRKLDRADKLRAMQVLVTELASEEQALILPGGHYEVWSPYDASSAAQALTALLEADKVASGAGSDGRDRRA